MKTTNKVQVNVGGLADMGKRFAGAWNRAQAGKPVDQTHVTFLDMQSMLDTLSPRRLDWLRHVRQHGAGMNLHLSGKTLRTINTAADRSVCTAASRVVGCGA